MLPFGTLLGPAAAAGNLAPNPSFERADNPSFPNGWTNYPEAVFYPHGRVGADSTEAFHGGKSLRVRVVPLDRVEEPFRAPYVHCYGIRTSPGSTPSVSCGPETGPYTLSAYLKADTPGVSVRMGTTGAQENAERTVLLDTQWQRFSATLRPCSSHGGETVRPEIYFRAGDNDRVYTFWVDAVQIEPGTAPTPFQDVPASRPPSVSRAGREPEATKTEQRPADPGRTGVPPDPVQAAYLDLDYYTDEPAAVLTVDLRPDSGESPASPWTARVTLGRSGAGGSRALRAGENEILLPLKEVPVGRTPVRVALADSTGEPRGSATLTLDRKPPSGTEVKVDRKRMCLRVGGRPFFPYLFGIGSPAPWPGSVKESRRIGLGGVITPFHVFGKQQDLKTARRELDRIHSLGMKAIVWIHPDEDDPPCGIPPWRDPACLPATARAIEKRIRVTLPALRDHPAVLAWKFADEWWDREATGRLYHLCKSLDPYRPAFHNQTGGKARWRGGETDLFLEPDLYTDILSWDVYPWGLPGGEDRMDALLEDTLEAVMLPLALRHRIPMMFWLQMINLYEREPTREEFLAELFALSVHGVRGFFTFFFKPDARELWSAAGEVGSMWGDLERIWEATPPGTGPGVTRADGLLVKEYEAPGVDSTLVFVNLNDRPREIAAGCKVPAGRSCQARELLTGTTVNIPEDGIVRDILPGKGARIFAVHCPVAPPPEHAP